VRRGRLPTEKAVVGGKGVQPHNRFPLTNALSFRKRPLLSQTPSPSTNAFSFHKHPLLRQTPFHPATALSLQQPSPFCHPERTRISYFTALATATYVVLPKENHMHLTEAATLDRKSGEAEGSAVLLPSSQVSLSNRSPLCHLEPQPTSHLLAFPCEANFR
jgi:hypothetical protein